MNSIDRLQEIQLSLLDFYNKLNYENANVEQYKYAQNVWESFAYSSMQEYMELFMKTDILLLPDVFENFTEASFRTYGLDPAYTSWLFMTVYVKICKMSIGNTSRC